VTDSGEGGLALDAAGNVFTKDRAPHDVVAWYCSPFP